MRKVLFDTNVLVDYLIGREPGCSACKYIIATAQEHQLALYATALSMKDAYYLVCANLKRLERNATGALSEQMAKAANRTAWACARQLGETVLVVPVGQTECLTAFTLAELHDDFEDDLIVAAAGELDADFLVTGDERLIKHAPVCCISPQYLQTFLQQSS